MVMENGFSSPRSEVFPAGLRVLVVDDDPTWLKILEKMLKKCSYEVTTSGFAREALRLLRDRKDGFDIVISDVNMPDMDGFKLLEHVGLEMDLPVIMMSVDGETSRVMKGVQHGACDYLLKPIRMKELKNIWQHVVRKRRHEVRDIEFIDDSHSNDGQFGGDQSLLKKRKDVENKHDDKDSCDTSSKKARVVWTVELHQKFVKAVNQIGIDSDKVGPKRILDLMNVAWLTRENVASHLQKYRLYLSRIGKGDENMESSFGGMNPDYSPKESGASMSLQHSGFALQNDVTSNHVYSGSQLPVQSAECKPVDRNLKSKTEPRKAFNNENSDPQRANSQSGAGLNQTFRSLETSAHYASFDSPVSGQYSWRGEVLDLQFKPEIKPQPKLRNSINQPVIPILQQQIQVDVLDPAAHICSAPSISESDNFSLIDVKPPISKQICNNVRQPSPLESALQPFSVTTSDAFGCVFDLPLDMKNQNSSQDNGFKKQPTLEGTLVSFHPDSHPSAPHGSEEVKLEITNQNSTRQASIVDQSSVNCSVTESRNQASGTESTFGMLGEDLMFRWLQGGDGTSKDFKIDDAGFSDSNFPEHVDQVSFPLYMPKFGLEYEYPFDWVEYPVVDQGLLFS